MWKFFCVLRVLNFSGKNPYLIKRYEYIQCKRVTNTYTVTLDAAVNGIQFEPLVLVTLHTLLIGRCFSEKHKGVGTGTYSVCSAPLNYSRSFDISLRGVSRFSPLSLARRSSGAAQLSFAVNCLPCRRCVSGYYQGSLSYVILFGPETCDYLWN